MDEGGCVGACGHVGAWVRICERGHVCVRVCMYACVHAIMSECICQYTKVHESHYMLNNIFIKSLLYIYILSFQDSFNPGSETDEEIARSMPN